MIEKLLVSFSKNKNKVHNKNTKKENQGDTSKPGHWKLIQNFRFHFESPSVLLPNL